MTRGVEKMFWSRKQVKEGEVKLSGPKGIPGPVGTYLVVQMKKGPYWVWGLKAGFGQRKERRSSIAAFLM
jgi:hypothetical protein